MQATGLTFWTRSKPWLNKNERISSKAISTEGHNDVAAIDNTVCESDEVHLSNAQNSGMSKAM